MSKKPITTKSSDDLDAMADLTRTDAAEGDSPSPDFWKNARIVHPEGNKERLTVRFDRDVVAWFKAQGRGYQTRMNAVLRSYYEAQGNDRNET